MLEYITPYIVLSKSYDQSPCVLCYVACHVNQVIDYCPVPAAFYRPVLRLVGDFFPAASDIDGFSVSGMGNIHGIFHYHLNAGCVNGTNLLSTTGLKPRIKIMHFLLSSFLTSSGVNSSLPSTS